MREYEDFIKERRRTGATKDSIAKAFTEAMNAIEKQEQLAKLKEAEQRTKLQERTKEINFHNCASGPHDTAIDQLVHKLTATVAIDNPSWGKKQIDEFYDTLANNVPVMVHLVNKDYDKIASQIMEDMIKSIETSCEKPETYKRPDPWTLMDTKPKTDEDVLANFLKNL